MFSKPNMIRFLEKVDADPESGCWNWIGGKHPRGYGIFWVNGRNIYAHRYFYEYLYDPVPSGLELDHVCRNNACVNPFHLEPVTHAKNMRRAALWGRWGGGTKFAGQTNRNGGSSD